MIKNDTFSERLNFCLDQLGFPPKNYGRIQLLANMVGLTHRGAGKWINGQSSPPAGKFPELAKQLKVNELWLRTGEGLMCAIDPLANEQGLLGVTLNVPLYHPNQLLRNEKKSYHTLSCILQYVSDFYGIVLKSEAMSPRFPLGSILIFDPQHTVKDGDFVLVHDPNHSEPIFRQMITNMSDYYLHAYNPKFERLTLEYEHRILGKLVQAIVSFE